MTNSNSHVNGASLEDCHTNFFALTDLCGIKWRSYRIEHVLKSDPLEDPVIFSFTKCLANDILSVWRRVQHAKSPPPPPPASLEPGAPPAPPPPAAPPTVTTYKELWIFWYGDEPELGNIIAPQLFNRKQDEGNWESGLSYECRSLLFKALHKFIERCLLSRGFVKLGKWFAQPCSAVDKSQNKPSSANLSFSFSFFVHGESTVCASLSLRQHAPLRRITRGHLSAAHGHGAGLPVVLAPYGLAGVLTGQTYRLGAPQTRKLVDAWGLFYPIDNRLLASMQMGREPHLPAVVEVLVGDVKMRYLTSYVLVTEAEAAGGALRPLGVSTHLSPGGAATPPVSPSQAAAAAAAAGGDATSPFAASSRPLLEIAADAEELSEPVPVRAWRQSTVASVPARAGLTLGVSAAGDNSPESLGQWDFQDPIEKPTCSCGNCKRKVKQKQQYLKRQEKERPPRMKSGVCHRRTALAEELAHTIDTDLVSGVARLNGAPPPPPPQAYYKSQVATPGSVRPHLTDGLPSVGPMDSPASMGPSPLPTLHSHQPSLVSADQTMPALSPHPPTPSGATPNPVTPLAGTGPDSVAPGEPKSVTETGAATPVYSPYPKPASVGAMPVGAAASAGADSEQKPRPPPAPAATSSSPQRTPLLRRPQLPTTQLEADVDMVDSSNLYDFSDSNLWLSCPVKRPAELRSTFLRRIKDEVDRSERLTQEGEQPQSQPAHNSNPMLAGDRAALPRGIKRPADPYAFDDDPSPGITMDGLKQEPDEAAGVPKVKADSLFTTEGLQPKPDDLDNLFDDRSDGDEGAVPTPPGSNKPNGAGGGGGADDAASGVGPGGKLPGKTVLPTTAVLTSIELSKIYPTPPSHEHNHNPSASPVCHYDGAPGEADLSALAVFKSERGDDRHPPQPQDRTDMSYVFRPSVLSSFVSSSKYSPLESLPSQQLPPCNLPMDAVYRPTWPYNQPQAIGKHAIVPSRPPPPGAVPLPMQVPLPPGPMQSMNQMAMTGMMTLPPSSAPATRPGLSPISPGHYDAGGPASLKSCPGSMGPQSVGGPLSVSGPHSVGGAGGGGFEPQSPAPGAGSYPGRGADAAGLLSLQAPEVSALLINVLLEDSMLNLFHDHNFDSCTMCVCNAGPNRVGNIRGKEAGLYIPDSTNKQAGGAAGSAVAAAAAPADSDELVSCKCGYSAVVNRTLAYRSGLFLEDEVELTGERREVQYERTKPPLLAPLRPGERVEPDPQVDNVPPELLQLIQEQCLTSPCMVNIVHRTAAKYLAAAAAAAAASPAISYLQYTDATEVVRSAIDLMLGPAAAAAQAAVSGAAAAPEHHHKHRSVMHKWPTLLAPGPLCNQDIVRVMRTLISHLQDAIQKKRQTKLWESDYMVSGPLTWRQFHRLAGRGTDDHCTPQPIPTLLVGHEGEWVSTSPFSLRHWDQLLLEPVAAPRDVAYLVVTPAGDNEFVLRRVRKFFRELSSTYDACQLGRHVPIGSSCPEGVLRINRKSGMRLATMPVDDWFKQLGDSPVAAKLKLYAQYCRHYVGPYLQTSMWTARGSDGVGGSERERPTPSPMPPPATPDAHDRAPATPKMGDADDIHGTRPGVDGGGVNYGPTAGGVGGAGSGQMPQMVVYFIDPFTYGAQLSAFERFINVALLRAYLHMRFFLPANLQKNITLQVISLESILSLWRDLDQAQLRERLRSLAFTVYSQCRRTFNGTASASSLTGFGPSAAAEQRLKGREDVASSVQMYNPTFLLAPLPDAQKESEVVSTCRDTTSTLYCSYCLSEDQRWLLAACTDERGELRQTNAINIHIPNRLRRRKVSARRIGLQKLMDWLLQVMVQSIHPWRLVVGRLGRIGHGELKSWSSVLSRKSLTRFSKQLREMCRICQQAPASEMPAILSACLVSLEPDPSHRLMYDQCTPEEGAPKPSSGSLSTPHDASCTHVMVFPTSATTQCSQTAFQQEHINPLGSELIEEELLNAINADEDGDLMGNGTLFDDLDLNWEDSFGGGDMGSPTDERPTASPSGGLPGLGKQGPFSNGSGQRGGGDEEQEEFGTVLQQPLALGYLPSTAGTGPMPAWFWAGAPHMQHTTPVFLRSALHLHCQTQNTEDMLQQPCHVKVHPLDSSTTTDVLRHVLENYNRLSWLALDPASQDRRSCLPIHMQLLVQLYAAMAAML